VSRIAHVVPQRGVNFMLSKVSPVEAKKLLDSGALLIDIREADEFAREHIPGARNEPLSKLGSASVANPSDIVIYHCKSGMRTQANVAQLKAGANCEAFILDGGLEAWKAAQLPVAIDKKQPLEMMRQVQIAAGSLVLAGIVLGVFIHPGFNAISAFAGAGLVYAGVSGFCGMARLLALMPWNRRAPA